jgi:hypothetical protein
MTVVLQTGTPLKINRSVIRPIVVNMVHLLLPLSFGAKRLRHKPVNEMRFYLAVL